MFDDLKTKMYYLTSETSKDWREILKLSTTLSENEKRQFCWAWPTEENLENLQEALKRLRIDRLLSIGCGNGLFEWLLQESISIKVFGLEVDRLWWESQYSVKNFIPLQYYADDIPLGSNILQQSCKTFNWNFALLFCYFNNRQAFNDYLHMYQGQWIIIIGPRLGTGIHTDPAPTDPKFPSHNEWLLKLEMPMGDCNVLVVYEKLQ